MSLYEQYDATDEAEVQFGPGLFATVLSDFHPTMRRFNQLQRKKYRQYLDMVEIPEEIVLQMDIEKAAKAIKGWRGEGWVGRDGSPLSYSPEHALQVMTDLPWLRRDVLIVCISKATFVKKGLDDLGKDSAPSSGSTSSIPTVGA